MKTSDKIKLGDRRGCNEHPRSFNNLKAEFPFTVLVDHIRDTDSRYNLQYTERERRGEGGVSTHTQT